MTEAVFASAARIRAARWAGLRSAGRAPVRAAVGLAAGAGSAAVAGAVVAVTASSAVTAARAPPATARRWEVGLNTDSFCVTAGYAVRG